MERDDVMERVRAARPRSAVVDGDAFDGALLARVMAQAADEGGSRRRRGRIVVALPVAAAGVTFAVAGAVMLAGGPDDVGGPSTAQAITSQTLHWLDPPAGTILHASSVETRGGQTTTRTIWQSADDPEHQRIVVSGTESYEQAGDVLYDPGTNTIYDAAVAAGPVKDHQPPSSSGRVKPGGGDTLPVGDPIVIKMRMLLQDGRMTVAGRELHDGVMAWKVSLKEDLGEPIWTFWVSADDGRPLEIVDPGRSAGDARQVVRWPTYEVVPESDPAASAALSLTGAHPDARVDHDPDAAEAAWQRVTGGKG
jgi:hypothetical protein